jgi:hypothetical protein
VVDWKNFSATRQVHWRGGLGACSEFMIRCSVFDIHELKIGDLIIELFENGDKLELSI